MPRKTKHPDGIEFYRDAKREHRWRAWRKGRIVAESGEGYKRLKDCINGMYAADHMLCLYSYEAGRAAMANAKKSKEAR